MHALEKCPTITNDSIFEKSNQKVYSLSSQDYQNQNGEIFFPPLKSSDSAKRKEKKKATDIFLGIREQSSDRSTTN